MDTEIEQLKFGIHSKKLYMDPANIQMQCPFVTSDECFSISTWDEVELVCASRGIPVTKEIFNFFVVGMLSCQNIVNMMLDAFKEQIWLKKFVKTADDVSLLYYVSLGYPLVSKYSILYTSQFSFVKKWIDIATQSDDESFEYPDGSSWPNKSVLYPGFYSMSDNDVKQTNETRKSLFSAIDLIDPFLLVRFYSQFDRWLFVDDKFFIRFLVSRTQIKAKYHPLFEKILEYLADDLKMLNYFTTYMN